MDRHNVRAYLMRQWRADAAQEELGNNKRARFQIERRLQRLQAQFEAAEAEKEIEKRTCSLCRLVRAEAWGLGHTRWKERQCSKCWATTATLRSHQQHRSHAHHRSYSDGECEHRTTTTTRHNRNDTAPTAGWSPKHAGYAAAQSRIAEGLGLLGVPLAPPSVPPTRSGRHGTGRGQGSLSHSYSFAPDWGAVAKAGASLGDPWEWQQQRMMKHHALKNELLLEQSVLESLHPVSRSARLYPRSAQLVGSTSAHRDPIETYPAASPSQVDRSASPFPALSLPQVEIGHQQSSMPGAQAHAHKRSSSNDGSSSRSSSENTEARARQQRGQQRRQGKNGIDDAQSDRHGSCGGDRGRDRALGRPEQTEVPNAEDLCAAVRSRDAEKLLDLLGPRVLERLLEGCLRDAPPSSPGYPDVGNKAAPPRTSVHHQRSARSAHSVHSTPWTQRRHPQYQHLHQHRHHAANAAQVEWAGSLRCMPGLESSGDRTEAMHGQGWTPEVKVAARRAAANAQKERRGWEAHVGMSWQEQRHPEVILNAGRGAETGEEFKGLGQAGSGGEVPLKQQQQQQQQQQQELQQQGEQSLLADERWQAAQRGMQEGLGEDGARALGISSKERKRRDRDISREETMRADLKRAEQELVMASTQEGRTAALFLACTLREELARLSRHNRKLLETRKHRARADTRDPLYGVKHMVGRQHPPETALPIAYDCHGYPRYAHDALQATHPSAKKSSDAGDAGAAGVGVGAGRGRVGTTPDGGLPEDGIVGATRLKPASRAPLQQQQQQQHEARKSSTAKGQARSSDSSSESSHSDGHTVPGLAPADRPHWDLNALQPKGDTQHHPAQQQSSTGASRKWGPGHPHTTYPRPPHHLKHPHLISDPCYAASPDPHNLPVLHLQGRLSSSFDPHHNLTHYQTYVHRFRHRKHRHRASSTAVDPQAQPQRAGTNYSRADAYSEAPPQQQQRYQSRAEAAAEAAVARLRDPYGYGTTNLMRDLAWTQVHPATPDPLLVADQVPFKPQASKSPVSRPGALDDADPQRAWEDLFSGVLQGPSQGARAKRDQDWAEKVAAWLCKSKRERVQEAKQLRAMPVDDFKLQLRKEREWQRAVQEVQSLLFADGGDRVHANEEGEEAHKDSRHVEGRE